MTSLRNMIPIRAGGLLVDVGTERDYNRTSQQGTKMLTTITLTAKQLKLLHQVFDEQLSVGTIEADEVATAEEVIAILAEADKNITLLY